MPVGLSSDVMPDARTWRRFVSHLPERIVSSWRLKALLGLTLSVLFCAIYLPIGHHPILPVRTLPLTAVDRAIGFHPHPWVWVYQSVYIPINLIPWLARDRGELRRFVKGFAALSLVSFIVFIVCPVRAPTPTVDHPTGMYWLLKLYDAPNNALPSLHAGLLVYTLAFGRRILGDELPRGLGALCVAWAGLILYSTLATKEHYAVDLLAGVPLGWLAHAWTWRADSRRSLSSSQRMSHAGLR